MKFVAPNLHRASRLAVASTEIMNESLIKSQIVSNMDLSVALCGEEGITLNGQHFAPDAFRGYFKFQLSHAFPQGATVYQTALHPAVIAKSYRSLLNQNINYEHQIASYHSDKDVRDRVIGAVVAVDFPSQPAGGWKLDLNATPPGITCVGVLFKQTQGMAKIMGEHSSSKRKYTVSMEVFYPLEEAGFAIELNGKDPKFDFSPPDFIKAGYEYVPYEEAPDELAATFSSKKSRIVLRYQGRKVYLMMGGLSNPVNYAGAGVVAFGAEPTAKILRMAASANRLLSELADKLSTTFRN